MTKSETLQALAEKLGKTRKEVSEFMEALVQLAYGETKKERRIYHSGLGQTAEKAQSRQNGPKPGHRRTNPDSAKTVFKFRVAKQAKDSIL